MTYLEQVNKAPSVLKSFDGDIWLGGCNIHDIARDADSEIANLKRLLQSARYHVLMRGEFNLVDEIEKVLKDD